MSCLQVCSVSSLYPLLTPCPQVKVQVDTIIKVLAASSLHWVVCLQPHPLAGLCELFRRPPGRSVSQKLLRDQVMRCRSLLRPHLAPAGAGAAAAGPPPVPGRGGAGEADRGGAAGGPGPGLAVVTMWEYTIYLTLPSPAGLGVLRLGGGVYRGGPQAARPRLQPLARPPARRGLRRHQPRPDRAGKLALVNTADF